MAGVRDIFPDIDEHILWTKITSPQDIDSFAGKFGNVIGIGQTVNQVGKIDLHRNYPESKTCMSAQLILAYMGLAAN